MPISQALNSVDLTVMSQSKESRGPKRKRRPEGISEDKTPMGLGAGLSKRMTRSKSHTATS